jgi:cytochrome c biogenesis protein CcmG, thiol:disulfide interchange protein DsbE
MKKWPRPKNIINLALLILLAVILIPRALENFKSEGIRLESSRYRTITAHGFADNIEFPVQDKKYLTIFWATWCGPCKVEMNRYHASIEAGKMKPENVIAINPFEDDATVSSFLKQHPYPFTFIEGRKLTELLNISVTPTTLLIENSTVTSRSSGMSVLGIWKAEAFLQP